MKSVLRWCVVPLLAGTLVAQTAAKPRAKKAAAKPAQPAVTHARFAVAKRCSGRPAATNRAAQATGAAEGSSLAAGPAAASASPEHGQRCAGQGGFS